MSESDNGSISLNLNYLDNQKNHEKEEIECSIDPSIGTAETISLTLNEKTRNYETSPLPSGYYILTVKSKEKSGPGGVELIKINPGNITELSLQVMSETNCSGPCLEILPRLKNNIRIVLTGTQDYINQGTYFVANTKNNISDAIYSWFIDGAEMESGPNSGSYATPPNLNKGYHRLDIMIFTIDGQRGGNATHIFEVI